MRKHHILLVSIIVLCISCAKDSEEQYTPTTTGVEHSYASKEIADTFYFIAAPDNYIQFSRGNLQYNASTGKWRFAEHQYDVIGAGNNGIAETYNGWIDLFGWGTSGYDFKHPYLSSTSLIYYPQDIESLAGTNYDWGVNNIIGDDRTADIWRTPTRNEWIYLLEGRPNAKKLYGLATVANVNGLILLPNNWSQPAEITFTSGAGDYSDNIYDTTQWSIAEQHGAIFMPATGYRKDKSTMQTSQSGYYWTTSAELFPCSTDLDPSGAVRMACGMHFYNGTIDPQYYDYYYQGFAVRLVN